MEARLTRRMVIPAPTLKVCTVCRRELPLVMFVKNKRSSDGLNYHCITCQKAKNTDRRQNFVRNASRY